jgi:NAD-dependent SIR2 family protein deacetylase
MLAGVLNEMMKFPSNQSDCDALRLLQRKLSPPCLKVKVGNRCHPVPLDQAGIKNGCQFYDWTVFLHEQENADNSLGPKIESVTFDLHPSFTPPSVIVSAPPYQITRKGWGTFPVRITIQLKNGEQFYIEHPLQFNKTLHESTFKFDLRFDPIRHAKRMDGVDYTSMHGHLAPPHWRAPIMVTECDVEARPGYQSMKAHEYLDDPETLRGKVSLLAALLKQAKCTVLYTGAGISTSSGIGDYATKSGKSVAKESSRSHGSGLDAEPTLAHNVLNSLYQAGHIAHWVQQNHDGLPQKAGFPQHCLNEIHGAWFDPSNPVVPMTGTLRDDLCKLLHKFERKADLCLAMGTSLCGMNADRMVTTPSNKFLAEKKGNERHVRFSSRRKTNTGTNCLGSVIVGLQQTQYDSISSLRIFGKIDEVMALLAWEMGITQLPKVDTYCCNKEAEPKSDLFIVPYDGAGKLQKKGVWSYLDLRQGAKIVVNAGPGQGFIGYVRGKTRSGHYQIVLPCIREGSSDHGKGQVSYLLGSWWVQQAVEGLTPTLPIINQMVELKIK